MVSTDDDDEDPEEAEVEKEKIEEELVEAPKKEVIEPSDAVKELLQTLEFNAIDMYR